MSSRRLFAALVLAYLSFTTQGRAATCPTGSVNPGIGICPPGTLIQAQSYGQAPDGSVGQFQFSLLTGTLIGPGTLGPGVQPIAGQNLCYLPKATITETNGGANVSLIWDGVSYPLTRVAGSVATYRTTPPNGFLIWKTNQTYYVMPDPLTQYALPPLQAGSSTYTVQSITLGRADGAALAITGLVTFNSTGQMTCESTPDGAMLTVSGVGTSVGSTVSLGGQNALNQSVSANIWEQSGGWFSTVTTASNTEATAYNLQLGPGQGLLNASWDSIESGTVGYGTITNGTSVTNSTWLPVQNTPGSINPQLQSSDPNPSVFQQTATGSGFNFQDPLYGTSSSVTYDQNYRITGAVLEDGTSVSNTYSASGVLTNSTTTKSKLTVTTTVTTDSVTGNPTTVTTNSNDVPAGATPNQAVTIYSNYNSTGIPGQVQWTYNGLTIGKAVNVVTSGSFTAYVSASTQTDADGVNTYVNVGNGQITTTRDNTKDSDTIALDQNGQFVSDTLSEFYSGSQVITKTSTTQVTGTIPTALSSVNTTFNQNSQVTYTLSPGGGSVTYQDQAGSSSFNQTPVLFSFTVSDLTSASVTRQCNDNSPSQGQPAGSCKDTDYDGKTTETSTNSFTGFGTGKGTQGGSDQYGIGPTDNVSGNF